MNYFELFELPAAPSIDRSLLAQKYFELQKKNHPDFYTQSTEMEQEDFLAISADINKAFTIFKDPQKTIEYFLQSIGLISENEKYNLPPDFLMEMMEMNEAFAETDEATTAKRVADYEALLYEEIKPVILGYNAGSTSKADLLMLKEYYYKKKYLNRILDRLGD
jgi:molecular chaperone HscB